MSELSEIAAKLNGDNIFFIVGCPRSGTTWLQRLLAAHPQIQTGQESRLFGYLQSQLRNWATDCKSASPTGVGGVGMACYHTAEEFHAIQKNYLAALMRPMLRQLSPGQIFMEKTPGHALYIPEIMQLLPNARIIHIVRDPRDTVASLLAASKGWGRRWAPNRAKKAAQVWIKHVGEARAAAAKVPTGNYLEISYEKLCADPAVELRALVHFLHLKWSDAEIADAVATNSADALRQDKGTKIPLQGEMAKRASHLKNPDGFVRKARPGTWREDLSPLQKWQMWRVLRKSPDARPFLGK